MIVIYIFLGIIVIALIVGEISSTDKERIIGIKNAHRRLIANGGIFKIRNILRYGFMKKFKRGVRLHLSLTFKCNIKCPYCSAAKPLKKMPRSSESTLQEWKDFIISFPYKLKEVKLSGGAVELYPDFIELIKWLLNKGYYVAISTNLMRPDILNKLPRSRRLILIASYHHTKDWCSLSPIKYTDGYNLLKANFRIVVHEIGNKKLLSYSWLKPLIIDEDKMQHNFSMLRVNPKRKIFMNCYEMHKKSIKL